jgi:hypothetical protein
MERSGSILKIPPKFLLGLLFVVVWVFGLIYLIMHVFLGVPVTKTVPMYLAFCGLTLALLVVGLWAVRYGARIKSTTPFMVVIACYGFVAFPLWGYFSTSLRVLGPRATIFSTCIAELLWGASFLWTVLRNRTKVVR